MIANQYTTLHILSVLEDVFCHMPHFVRLSYRSVTLYNSVAQNRLGMPINAYERDQK